MSRPISYDIMLEAHVPGTGDRRVIPGVHSLQVSFVADGWGALVFTVPKGGPGHAILNEPCEVSVRVWDDRYNNGKGAWIEPPNGRFLNLSGDSDLADETGMIKFTCKPFAWLMTKIKVHKGSKDAALVKASDDAKKAMDDKKREFDSAQSAFNKQVGKWRSRHKLLAGNYVWHFFPKGPVKHKSTLYHTGKRALYWWNVNKWVKLYSPLNTTANLNALYTAGAAVSNRRREYEALKTKYDRAFAASAESTRGGNRPTLNATPGRLLKRFWDEGRARGAGRLATFTRSWSATHDSNGRKWTTRNDYDARIGSSLGDVLQTLVDAGHASWQTRGRTLDLVPYGALTVNHGNRIGLHLSRDITEAPDKWTMEGYANSFLLMGESDRTLSMAQGGPTEWGTWEESINISGGKSNALLKNLSQGERREMNKRVRLESTRGLIIHPTAHRPMIDYLPHHIIQVYGETGQMESVTVQQITLTRDDKGYVSGNIVLGDRLLNGRLKWVESVNKMNSGFSSQVGYGRTMTYQPLGNEATLAAPENVSVEPSLRFTADGKAQVVLSVGWEPGVDGGVEETDAINHDDTEVEPID